MSEKFTKSRAACRLCGSTLVVKAFDMPDLPLVDTYTRAPSGFPRVTASASPFSCMNCGHLQLLTVIPPEILYSEYIYTSESSPDLFLHFKEYSKKIFRFSERFQLRRRLLDIGSNDGLFLQFAKSDGFFVRGVDPARIPTLRARGRGIDVDLEFFSSSYAEQAAEKYGRFEFITANNVFSHSDNISDVLAGVNKLLTQDGIFVFEVSYLLDTVNNNVLDYVYHEHLDFHSIQPLNRFFRANGFRIFNVERIATKGGSVRCYVCFEDAPYPQEIVVDLLMELESGVNLHSLRLLRAWRTSYFEQVEDQLYPVRRLAEEGRPVLVYGANATSVVLVHVANLVDDVNFVVDDNPLRQGLFSPLNDSEVMSAGVLQTLPDWVCIVGAWRFSEAILAKRGHLASDCRKFIVPVFPKFFGREFEVGAI